MTGLAALVVLAGTLGAAKPRGYAFSHAEHVARAPTLSCADCHDVAQRGSKAPTPAPQVRASACIACHDDTIPAVAPPRHPPGRRTALGVIFDHRPHDDVIAGACNACHAGDGGADGNDTMILTATSATCFGCHARSLAAPQEQACVQCHGSDRRRVPPATHASSLWTRAHGASAQPFAPQPHGQSCVLCHRESSCTSCHRVEKPQDHTALWATRTHGTSASFDSARCKTCHETGSCIGCHRTTEPANHRGAWKSTHGLVARTKSDASCQACHKASFCIDCHRGGGR